MPRTLMLTLLATIALLVVAPAANAATLTVGAGCLTIQSCIDAAVDGDVVMIPAGTYAEQVVLDKPVSLAGAGPSTTIIDAGGAGRPLTIDGSSVSIGGATSLSGLTLTGGALTGNVCPDDCGGGLLLTSAAPTLADLVIADNSAYRGGGLYADETSPISATDVDLVRNTAVLTGGGAAAHAAVTWSGGEVADNISTDNIGGGITVSGPDGINPTPPEVLIDGVAFRDNQANTDAGPVSVGHAGALSVFQAHTRISDSTFTGNTCQSDDGRCNGGAVWAITSFVDMRLEIIDSSFTSNRAEHSGGAVAASSPLLDIAITGSSFMNNSAAQGGGLHVQGGSIHSSTFTDNVVADTGVTFADGHGGGVYGFGCPSVAASTFDGNDADFGGGIACLFGGLSLTDTTLVGNSATGDGGGAHSEIGGTSVTGGALLDNVAAGDGGGLWSRDDVTATGTQISGNTAARGGGVHVDAGSLTISDGIVSSNESTADVFLGDGGGGAFVTEHLTATATSFDANTAAGQGGAAVVIGHLTAEAITATGNHAAQTGGAFNARGATVVGSSFTGNHAGFAGGAVRVQSFIDGSAALVTGSTFADNTAGAAGGALSAGEVLHISDSIFTGNAADGGGAVQATERLTIADSVLSGNTASSGSGGAVLAFTPFVTTYITASSFIDNTASASGGAISASTGNLQLSDVDVSSNTASADGGGVHAPGSVIATNGTDISGNSAQGDGGGVWANSRLTLHGATIANNSAGGSGGGAHLGLGSLEGTAGTIRDNTAGGDGGGATLVQAAFSGLTVSGNSADGDGGGLFVQRFGEIDATSIEGNTAGGAGGGLFHGGRFSGGSLALEITGSTIASNEATAGDGTYFSLDRPVRLRNSTLSGDGIVAPDVRTLELDHVTVHNPLATALSFSTRPVTSIGTLVLGTCSGGGLASLGANVESAGDTCGFDAATDRPGVATTGLIDPALADNGGPTATHALPPGSPAIDVGGTCPALDQRGVARDDGACDAGAFEAPPPPPPTGEGACGPGYWRQRHHHDSWVSFTPSDALSSVLGRPLDGTLQDALTARGGGLRALLRHAGAALLNAAHPDLDPGESFDTTAEVVAAFQAAFDSGDHNPTKNAFEATHADADCPLS